MEGTFDEEGPEDTDGLLIGVTAALDEGSLDVEGPEDIDGILD